MLVQLTRKLSVSALEAYGRCPFKFFADHVLRIERRPDHELTPMDLGQLRHHVLQEVYLELRETDGLDWGQVTGEAADPIVERAVGDFLARPDYADRLRDAPLESHELDTVARDLKRFVRALALAGRRSALRQVAAERPFQIDLPGGEQEHAGKVHGIIDRIDADPETGIRFIHDYKSSPGKVSLLRVLAGVDVQLVCYAVALDEEPEPGRIAGAFIWPMRAPWREVGAGEGPPPESADPLQVDARWFDKDTRAVGIFSRDVARLLEGPADADAAAAFGFRFKKDGDLYANTSGALDAVSFARLLAHQRGILHAWARALAAGHVGVRPFRIGTLEACRYCDLRPVCRLDEGQRSPRRWIRVGEMGARAAFTDPEASLPADLDPERMFEP